MSAEEALRYGLIDEIVQPNDAKLKAMALPPPAVAPQLFGEVPQDAKDYEFGKLVRILLRLLFQLDYFREIVEICVICNYCGNETFIVIYWITFQ